MFGNFTTDPCDFGHGNEHLRRFHSVEIWIAGVELERLEWEQLLGLLWSRSWVGFLVMEYCRADAQHRYRTIRLKVPRRRGSLDSFHWYLGEFQTKFPEIDRISS
jgi:hypothetical protein